MDMGRKLGAEFIGTFWLVLGGCGSAVLAAGFPEVGIGLLGVSLAFGLTVLTMAFAIGHISGCHLNPAVSVGLWMGGRFSSKELAPYIIVQVLGGLAGGTVLYLIASGQEGFMAAGNQNAGPVRRPHRLVDHEGPRGQGLYVGSIGLNDVQTPSFAPA